MILEVIHYLIFYSLFGFRAFSSLEFCLEKKSVSSSSRSKSSISCISLESILRVLWCLGEADLGNFALFWRLFGVLFGYSCSVRPKSTLIINNIGNLVNDLALVLVRPFFSTKIWPSSFELKPSIFLLE